MASVTITHVSKVYPNGQQAVGDVSLAIKDGEFLVLVGPSGCGKSTLLRMIAGLEDVTSGTISIGEQVVNEVAPKDRDIAMVFQNYALYPHMTVRKNMAFALSLRGVAKDEIERRIAEAARSLGIEEYLSHKPGELSGGQRQRVALGRAIVREPRAFLFDEPLSNLDAKLRVTTRAELKTLHHRLRTTAVYVTHDQEEAMTLGDRIAVMSKGRLQQVGTPLEVYQRPANRFVAGFVGTPPMNFIDGTVTTRDGRPEFMEAGGPGGLVLRVSERHRAALAGSDGRRVVLGLRAQSWREASGEHGTDSAWRGRVTIVEPLGATMDIGFRSTSHPLVARVAAHERLSSGSEAVLVPNMDEAHWFEPGEFGARIEAN